MCNIFNYCREWRLINFECCSLLNFRVLETPASYVYTYTPHAVIHVHIYTHEQICAHWAVRPGKHTEGLKDP